MNQNEKKKMETKTDVTVGRHSAPAVLFGKQNSSEAAHWLEAKGFPSFVFQMT